MSQPGRLEAAQLPFIASLGSVSVAALAVQMLRLARVEYRFDTDVSDNRVHEQAIGLAWHGNLLVNLRSLADSAGLVLEIDGNIVRFLREENL